MSRGDTGVQYLVLRFGSRNMYCTMQRRAAEALRALRGQEGPNRCIARGDRGEAEGHGGP
jgi:hypothetical protein